MERLEAEGADRAPLAIGTPRGWAHVLDTRRPKGRLTALDAPWSVYERALDRCRACIRRRNYVMTFHAGDELEADGYTIGDLEAGVLSGSIVPVQRDISTRERKYIVRGATITGRAIELVAKFGVTGSMVVITVYEP